MEIKEYIKVIILLPVNVLVTIPIIISLISKKKFSFNFIGLNNLLFYLSIIFLVVGLWLAIWSVKTFYLKGGKGTPGPWNPVTNLIVSGPYRYIRNPMLLGVFFLLISESIIFSSIPILCWFLIFFIGNIFYFKKIEEKDLIKRFGSDYEKYKNNVPMLFPKISSFNNFINNLD
tara:strand:- start:349 stop:870 length:522 start_codon:yes stop_codon:yes gene_type:complete